MARNPAQAGCPSDVVDKVTKSDASVTEYKPSIYVRLHRALAYSLACIADSNRAHHWYWGLAAVAVAQFTAQCVVQTTSPQSIILETSARMTLVYATIAMMVLEQTNAKVNEGQELHGPEIMVSILAVACTLTGLILRFAMGGRPLFHAIGAYCFNIGDVIMYITAAYHLFVGKAGRHHHRCVAPILPQYTNHVEHQDAESFGVPAKQTAAGGSTVSYRRARARTRITARRHS